MKFLSGVLDAIDRILVSIGGGAVMLAMCIGVAEIIGRGVFNAPIPGQIDMIESLMPLIALLALALNLRDGSHIRMSLLIDGFPDRLRHGIEAIGMVLGALIGGALALGAAQFGARALRYSDSTPDLRLPTWPVKYVVAFCLALFTLRCAIFAISHFRVSLGADPQTALLPGAGNELGEKDAHNV